MADQLVTIPSIARVYLKDKSLWKSGHHTAFAAPGGSPNDPNSHADMYTLVFEFGVARDVERTVYDVFAKAGIATTDRPTPTDQELFRSRAG